MDSTEHTDLLSPDRKHPDTAFYIDQIEQQRKEQDAIYHTAALRYGLSDTAMWVLYLVSDPAHTYTQQELCQQCFCAKQTINTTITGLVKNGFMELEVIPGTRNQKKILLTEKGKQLAKSTTRHLRSAELRAYSRLSSAELSSYLEITQKLTAALRKELEHDYTVI